MEFSMRQIKEFLKWAKEQGFTKVSIGEDGIKVELSKVNDNLTQANQTFEEDDQPSEEDLLYWSS